jgi:putative PIN family toxin of toxin-antitoxin system
LRAVLDPNVLIAAMLSRRGSPASVFRAWLGGGFELVVSPLLLAELERALGYPKLGKPIASEEGEALIDLLGRAAMIVDDPLGPPPLVSRDPGDDYLLCLAVRSRAALVTGDRDLLTIAADLPIYSPAGFITAIAQA